MKKMIAWLIALTLCLGMAGCGSNDEAIGTIWEGDDEYIDMGGEQEEPGQNVIPENTEKPSSWDERIAGEYQSVAIRLGSTLSENIVMNANNTCSIWGGNYTWKIQDSNETSANVGIFDGNTLVFVLNVGLQEQGYLQARLVEIGEDGNPTGNKNCFFINLSDVYVIELTPENWQDYFEFYEVSNFWNDGGMSIHSYYQLKEEYLNTMIEELSRGMRIHYNLKFVKQQIHVDQANKTYRWGDIVETRDDYYVHSDTIGNINMEGVVSTPFGFVVDMITVDKFPQDEVTRREYTPERFSGTIYCVREK